MYFVSKKLKKKYNITDERAALYEAAETWVDALDGREFLGMCSNQWRMHISSMEIACRLLLIISWWMHSLGGTHRQTDR